jgi:low affinity Fe/Cu permease
VSASVKHPVQRGGEGRSRFDHFAESVSNLTSSPWFFWACIALVGVWGLSYALGWPETTRQFLGELLAALTLALVALLKNAELRAEHAIQYKLDAIAAAMLEARTDGDERHAADDLEAAIGRHEEV